MRVLRSSVFWGAVLVVVGGVLMFEALGFLGTPLVWSALFASTGLAFLYAYIRSSNLYWWAAIPGFALLGLAAATVWDQSGPPYLEEVGGALFLASTGIGFLAVYLASREAHSWALIPGGLLLTLAVVAGLSSTLEGAAIAVVLFLGFALSFALLAVLPGRGGQIRWPLVVAAVFAVVGVLAGIGAAGVLNYVWPAALILGGLYLIVRAFGQGGGSGRHA